MGVYKFTNSHLRPPLQSFFHKRMEFFHQLPNQTHMRNSHETHPQDESNRNISINMLLAQNPEVNQDFPAITGIMLL